MKEGKDYIAVKNEDEVPKEWKDKVEAGEAVVIQKYAPVMSSTILTVVIALLLGGALITTLVPAAATTLTVWSYALAGSAWAYLYYTAGKYIASIKTSQSIERAAVSGMLADLIHQAKLDGTLELDDGLNKEEDGSDSVH